jgi:hypothetical protein
MVASARIVDILNSRNVSSSNIKENKYAKVEQDNSDHELKTS